MKKFVSALCLMLLVLFAHGSLAIPLKDVGLESIAGKVIGVEPLCPKGQTCAVNGIRLSLVFAGSCKGRTIDPVYEAYDGQVIIHAQRALEKGLMNSSLCFSAAPGAGYFLNLVDIYPPITVRFLGTKESIQIN